MSSGFVSGGTTEQPIERDSEWLKAQQEVEANFRRKQEEGQQTDGKSLYEILQQNKAAKQEAFEESARLKNQFRTLDDDEVEFLDSVLESTREKEAAVKKETAEGLEAFRKQREEAERALLEEASNTVANNAGAESAADQETWVTSNKKRRRAKNKDKDIPLGAKLRKLSSSAEEEKADKKDAATGYELKSGGQEMLSKLHDVSSGCSSTVPSTQPSSLSKEQKILPASSKTSALAGLGLGGYSSDED